MIELLCLILLICGTTYAHYKFYIFLTTSFREYIKKIIDKLEEE